MTYLILIYIVHTSRKSEQYTQLFWKIEEAIHLCHSLGLGQVWIGLVRIGQVWLGKFWLDKVWLGFVMLGQVWLGQVRFGQYIFGPRDFRLETFLLRIFQSRILTRIFQVRDIFTLQPCITYSMSQNKLCVIIRLPAIIKHVYQNHVCHNQTYSKIMYVMFQHTSCMSYSWLIFSWFTRYTTTSWPEVQLLASCQTECETANFLLTYLEVQLLTSCQTGNATADFLLNQKCYS